MNTLLLLVHSHEDVAHLDGAAKAIQKLGTRRVMVLHSPAIVINQAEASAELDAEIAAILAAEKAAADRGDYEAAAGYKRTRDEKSLDRAKTIADAWKTMPQDAQRAAITKIFTPFIQTLNPDQKTGVAIRVTKHQDHYDAANWMMMIQAIAASWPKEMAPGTFSVCWPGQLAGLNLSAEPARVDVTPVTPVQAEAPKPVNKPPRSPKPAKQAIVPATTREARGEQLKAQPFFGWRKAAIDNGVPYEGRIKEHVIAEILNKEFPPVAA